MAKKEYIERGGLFRTIENVPDNELLGNDNTTFVELPTVLDIISEQPIADVQEVRHGNWETIIDAYGHIEGWLHKECGRQVTSKDEYCPHCGAKMDKE